MFLAVEAVEPNTDLEEFAALLAACNAGHTLSGKLCVVFRVEDVPGDPAASVLYLQQRLALTGVAFRNAHVTDGKPSAPASTASEPALIERLTGIGRELGE